MAVIMEIYVINVSRDDCTQIPKDQIANILQFAEEIMQENAVQLCRCTHENTAPSLAAFRAISSIVKVDEITKDKNHWPDSDSCYRFKAMSLNFIGLASSGITTQFIICENNTALSEHFPKYLAKELNADLKFSDELYKSKITQIICENSCGKNTVTVLPYLSKD